MLLVLQKRSEFGRWAHLRGQQQTLRPQLSSRRQEAQQGAGPTTWERWEAPLQLVDFMDIQTMIGDIYWDIIDQWEFQDPKMEVLYHIRPYFGGIFPYIGLT